MALLIRRSNLLVPITEPGLVQEAWRHNADAITLDLEDSVPDTRKAEARALVKGAIEMVGQGAAEVFVRVNKPFLEADIEASVWPGLNGIVLPRVETAQEVAEASTTLKTMEAKRGIETGSLLLVVLLESASAVWNIREIVTADVRVSQVGLDESDLAAALCINPLPEYDPFVYARGRLAIEATAAGVQPVGAAYPLGTHPRELPEEEVHKVATDSKNLGFKGILCLHPSWIKPVNAAFTPTESRVEYYTQVRQIFAQAVAAGTAAVPFHGRMIDVPVDEWAKVVLEMASACAARDKVKQEALEQASARS